MVWKDSTPKEILRDKAVRSGQPRPEWAAKTSWQETDHGASFYFGVGSAPKSLNTARMVRTAEDQARAEVAKRSGPAPRKSSGSTLIEPVDWYWDRAARRLFVLAVAIRELPDLRDP